MSEQDEIDERRARAIAGVEHDPEEWENTIFGIRERFLDIARAIRLSDEAAGYITAKVKSLQDVEREAGA